VVLAGALALHVGIVILEYGADDVAKANRRCGKGRPL
jgi:hypothetical protein